MAKEICPAQSAACGLSHLQYIDGVSFLIWIYSFLAAVYIWVPDMYTVTLAWLKRRQLGMYCIDAS